MKKPARRDGTPDRNKKPAQSARRGQAPRTQQTRSSKSGSRTTGSGRPAFQKKSQSSAPRISNARPAPEGAPLKGAALPDTSAYGTEGVRLQKVLAQAGVASRRVCEQMIDQRRVEVNGKVVTTQGMRIDPRTAIVKVDGMRVMITEDLVHLALNKPRGWQSTMADELGRPCVGDLVANRVEAGQRLFHVGRLDAETEGLLLLTNDGELAHRLMHPSYRVKKTYLAEVDGVVRRTVDRSLLKGVELDDGPVEVDEFAVVDASAKTTLVKVVLHEGRKHIVRRLLEHVGHPVTKLVRTQIGSVHLGDQRPGTIRVLNRQEVGALYKEVGL
ncbi:rRNA pseudouridine synthase [Hoyosella sp. YIM 151337]|uniref:pseudouridine synthase n=1 Tax=Hoyosella sp. YIM 151337 TaxID=2992742 RepID=UPI002236993B|nr:pseudouridine synthase [Hoyosella sp. YIM 151337]MCW4353985.1 rRNA pseudouridine synthase [Hoyosella sp. YIM 151337]